MDSAIDSLVSLPWRKIAVGSAAAFLGYCAYFDYKRTHAPDYQDDIRRRRATKAQRSSGVGSSHSAFPDVTNPQDMQAFFMQEVQLGEELMASPDPNLVEEGAEHLANAILFCGHSEQLLSIFQQTFPPQQFQMVMSKLPAAKGRFEHHMMSVRGDEHEERKEQPTIMALDDDDLE